MKIHPQLTVIQGRNSSTTRRPQKPPGESDFARELSAAADSTRDVVEVVSLENRRAGRITAPADMDAAEKALRRAEDLLGGMSKSDLRSVHRLEGLVHVFTT